MLAGQTTQSILLSFLLKVHVHLYNGCDIIYDKHDRPTSKLSCRTNNPIPFCQRRRVAGGATRKPCERMLMKLEQREPCLWNNGHFWSLEKSQHHPIWRPIWVKPSPKDPKSITPTNIFARKKKSQRFKATKAGAGSPNPWNAQLPPRERSDRWPSRYPRSENLPGSLPRRTAVGLENHADRKKGIRLIWNTLKYIEIPRWSTMKYLLKYLVYYKNSSYQGPFLTAPACEALAFLSWFGDLSGLHHPWRWSGGGVAHVVHQSFELFSLLLNLSEVRSLFPSPLKRTEVLTFSSPKVRPLVFFFFLTSLFLKLWMDGKDILWTQQLVGIKTKHNLFVEVPCF